MTDPATAPANTTAPARNPAALALVVGLVLACNGGIDGDSPAATGTSTTTATTTASVAPASTSPTSTSLAAASTSGTVGSTSTVVGASTTTTTVLVLTTLQPLGTEEAAVAEAAAAARTASEEALADPDAPGVQDRLDATFVANGQARAVLEANMQFLRDEGYRLRQNPENPRRFTVEDVTLLDGPPATHAHVTACVNDTAITYEPGGAPDGSDATVNDDIFTVRVRYTVVVEDGVWRLLEAFNLTEVAREVMECPPA